MSARLIYVSACDGSTSVVLDLTDAEYAVIQRIAAAVDEASEYSCMPIIQTASAGEPHYGWPSETTNDDTKEAQD